MRPNFKKPQRPESGEAGDSASQGKPTRLTAACADSHGVVLRG